jgi:hypothetical protein
VTNMHEQLIDVLGRERREQMLREAETYRLMIDRANLSFGPGPITRSRRALAHFLQRVAAGLEPCADRAKLA